MLVSIFQSPPRQPGGVVGADVKPWPVYIYVKKKKKKKKAIIWTNADLINWRIYAAQGGDELN